VLWMSCNDLTQAQRDSFMNTECRVRGVKGWHIKGNPLKRCGWSYRGPVENRILERKEVS
jgi:hypothetical protein